MKHFPLFHIFVTFVYFFSKSIFKIKYFFPTAKIQMYPFSFYEKRRIPYFWKFPSDLALTFADIWLSSDGCEIRLEIECKYHKKQRMKKSTKLWRSKLFIKQEYLVEIWSTVCLLCNGHGFLVTEKIVWWKHQYWIPTLDRRFKMNIWQCNYLGKNEEKEL